MYAIRSVNVLELQADVPMCLAAGTEYIEAIMAFTVFTMTFFCLPETYVPILLNRKARRLRNSTGDLRWWRPQEKQRIKLQDIVTKHLGRPL